MVLSAGLTGAGWLGVGGGASPPGWRTPDSGSPTLEGGPLELRRRAAGAGGGAARRLLRGRPHGTARSPALWRGALGSSTARPTSSTWVPASSLVARWRAASRWPRRPRATRGRRVLRRDEVPVELRGAGASTRQVHNFGTPDALDAAAFIVCEVHHPRRQLLVAPGPQARPARSRPGVPARGDLLLRGGARQGRAAPEVAEPSGSSPPTPPAPGDRHPRAGPHRRHRRAAARGPAAPATVALAYGPPVTILSENPLLVTMTVEVIKLKASEH